MTVPTINTPTTAPPGTWPSPITPRRLAEALRLIDVAWDAATQTLVWLEERGDRGVLVAAPTGTGDASWDVLAEGSVRARVGYGGGEFAVAEGHVVFAGEGGRLHRQPLRGGPSAPITPAFGYAASPAISPDGQWVVYVHTYEGQDCLAVVDAAGSSWPQRLVAGEDFYMQPRWHPSGDRLAYVCWNHPGMPWDGTVLRIARLAWPGHGAPPVAVETTTVDGGEDVAIFQPEFTPDGRSLLYISDETGWPNLWRLDLESGARRVVWPDAAEHGRPAWRQGLRTYCLSGDGRVAYVVRNAGGFAGLWRCDLASGQVEGPMDGGLGEYTWLQQPVTCASRAPGGGVDEAVAMVATSPRRPPRLVVWQAGGQPQSVRVVRRSAAEDLPEERLSPAEPVSWTGPDGMAVYGLLYRPVAAAAASGGLQPSAAQPPVGRPAAVVRVHGGPTSQSVAGWTGEIQFLTTRGYCVLDVNYRGSTGYGRPYMQALRGQWGVLDVMDAVSAAAFLETQGIADGQRVVIMGASAGGFTVLQALATHPGRFRAGICLFGVSNLFNLAADTHKFEARYLDSLVGPLPQAAPRYRERSPIYHVDAIRDPLAIFQGGEDRVVPKEQSESIVESLRRRRVPHEYHLYQGEGHGWRRPETIEAFYRALDAFLRRWVIYA